MPFPAGMKMEQVKDLAAFDLRGQVVPIPQRYNLQLFPGGQCPRKTGMAVTPDGRTILRLAGGIRHHGPERMSAVGTDGSAVWKDPAGAQLRTQTVPASKDKKYRGAWNRHPVMTVSPDGKWAYVAGHAYKKAPYAAVFRVPLPARAPSEPFFGRIDRAGKGRDLLGDKPAGLACDGKGNLLISDAANGRVVVVSEKTGKYVGEFAASKPGLLAVAPKTGAVYLASGSRAGITVTKYSDWKNPRQAGKITFRGDGNGTYVMGLDGNAPRPIVWIGTDGGSLIRIEDQGSKFSDAVRVTSRDSYDGNIGLDMSVDRFRPDPEVYCRGNRGWWIRYNEKTGKTERVNTGGTGLRNGGGGGGQIMAGPDGNIYALWYPYHMIKLDRNAKRIGFKEGGYPDIALAKYGKMQKPRPTKGGMWVPANMTEIKHTLGIRADGNVFVLHPPGSGGRPPKALHMYSPEGKKLTKDPIIWKVSDGCIGPRFDAAGNIYVAEIVNPGGQPYPEEFVKILGKVKPNERPRGVKNAIANMYGSVVKFSPKGGMFHLGGPDPFKGKPKFDGLKTIEAAAYYSAMQRPTKITGAEWLAFGYSHVEIQGCICETTRFDVDEFGRVFYPDLCLYQVRVVDTNGNKILNFGGYGNAESMGPESPVIDKQTGKLRPPKPGEKSPYARPEIAFAWLVGVGVTDKHVYTADGINRRLLRLKYEYAAEETCAVR
jgi:hypothetical protein